MSDEPAPRKSVAVLAKRKGIPQSIRFEVFKRDAFTCQYCGAKAPDVVLNVDHIKPVADGGQNDIINLVTSCFSCNSGKSDVALDDNSALSRQRKQLEDLNERRTQLELLVKWRESLADLEGDYLAAIQAELERQSGWTANDTGARELRRWLKKYSFNEVIEAVAKSMAQYLKYDGSGNVDSNTWNRAFYMIPRIIDANRSGGIAPAKMKMFYIRGILRNRLAYVNEREVLRMMETAVDLGASLESIEELAKNARNWTTFENALNNYILSVEADKQ